ncbi:MAG: tetratricopeptide repeat protein [Pyrinomonadaceae bacterium]
MSEFRDKYFRPILLLSCIFAASTLVVEAQTSRPRRVNPPETLLGPGPKSPPVANKNAPLVDVRPARPVGEGPVSADTSHAYQLLQQKQYAAAAKEAKQIAASYPTDPEAWKIAGFAELSLKQYAEASTDLQKALDLQRAARQEDSHTVDALAEAYVLSENFEQALPLLVSATARQAAKPDAVFLYYRGLAEFKTGKAKDAEQSFNAAIKANPKDAASLYFLGQIALSRGELDAAIAALNRATVSDPRQAPAWASLTSAYLRRAGTAGDTPKADADNLSAVRAGEGLTRVRTDEDAVRLFGQALISAKLYPRAAAALEPVSGPNAKAVTLYLLGVAHSRANNFPKAIAAFERANTKAPEDMNVFRELGYAYEKTKQYARAFALYQKALQAAPDDADFKESLERVRPAVKP